MVSSKLVYLLRNTGFLNSMSCFTQDFESVHNNIFLTALNTVTPFNICLYNFPCSCQMFITVKFQILRDHETYSILFFIILNFVN